MLLRSLYRLYSKIKMHLYFKIIFVFFSKKYSVLHLRFYFLNLALKYKNKILKNEYYFFFLQIIIIISMLRA